VAHSQRLKAEVLADGVIGDPKVQLIRRELSAGDRIDKGFVDFLRALRDEARSACPAFEGLYFRALKDNALRYASLSAEEARWLRQTLFADGEIDEAQK
jgi:hypothetical protein